MPLVEREQIMRRWITRLVVFALSVSLGASAWYILAQKKAIVVEPAESVGETPVAPDDIKETSEAQPDAPAQSINLGPFEPVSGYANAKTVILRESPDASARVVVKLKADDYESVEILGATRDFIHVRFAASDGLNGREKRDSDYEGWTDWGSVVPRMLAIILDADTGAVVAHVPLGSEFMSVAYSPDGERATFYGGPDGSTIASEFRTSDYTFTRSLSATTSSSNGTLFYAPSDGGLYLAALSRNQDYQTTPTKLSFVRIGDGDSITIQTELSGEAEDFAVAPDGLTGFVLHREDKQRNEMWVDVVDLHTFQIRNSFTLQGTDLPQVASVFVVNDDGSELYTRLNGNDDPVSVIDTRTGQLVRVLSFDSKTKDYWYFDRGDLVGDSLLLRIWNQDEDEMHTPPHAFWLGSSGRVAAEQGISSAVQAGNTRYAVNDKGTRLLKLDSNNHIRARFAIERPDLRKGADDGAGLSVFGLSASPDGKRLILFLGIEDGC
jgi:DNA-binding beta-propeller fold protein YncE